MDIAIHTNISKGPNESTMTQLGYDYFIDCTGYKFTGPRRFMTQELSECIDPRTG